MSGQLVVGQCCNLLIKTFGLTLFAKFPVWEAEFPCSLVLVSSAIVREKRIPARGLGSLSSVIVELRASAEKSHHRLQKVLNRTEEVEASELGIGLLGGQGECEGGH